MILALISNENANLMSAILLAAKRCCRASSIVSMERAGEGRSEVEVAQVQSPLLVFASCAFT